ncbi:hypothetical protein NL676_022841 [Syzygium grande]|nr:hypothetical protein NL676_022841 [Syzygium grande]
MIPNILASQVDSSIPRLQDNLKWLNGHPNRCAEEAPRAGASPSQLVAPEDLTSCGGMDKRGLMGGDGGLERRQDHARVFR